MKSRSESVCCRGDRCSEDKNIKDFFVMIGELSLPTATYYDRFRYGTWYIHTYCKQAVRYAWMCYDPFFCGMSWKGKKEREERRQEKNMKMSNEHVCRNEVYGSVRILLQESREQFN